MYDLPLFHQRVRELYRRVRVYDDNRRPTQQDLAEAVGLSLGELNKRLNGKQATRLTDRDARAIVRTLADWEAITTQAEVRELLDLVDCPDFTLAEWQSPPLADLIASSPRSGRTLFAPTKAQVAALPLPLTSFVGREREMGELKRLIPEARLITLLGAGGAGKTRLALEVAARLVDEFASGVYLVELAGVSDPQLVPQAVASALDVREQADESLSDTLTQYLRPRELLLILDNAEHLANAVAELAHYLLRSCARLHLLVTSRERLRTPGERSFPVPPLALPPPTAALTPAQLREYEAVLLFVDRAQAVWPAFQLTEQNAPAVREVCARLDGLPLAIELAAARTQLMSVQEIAARLANRFRLLAVGERAVQPRQQTLRTLVDWSYDLLTPAEQRLLRRLAVFAASFSLAAVEQICGGDESDATPPDSALSTQPSTLDLLGQLMDKSLLVRLDTAGPPRYRLLETIREYAWARLVASGDSGVMRRHALYYLSVAEQAAKELLGDAQVTWLARFEEEHDNFRAALTWTLEAGETELALRLATALWRFWYSHGYLSEGRGWMGAALARPGEVDVAVRARALNGAGGLAWSQGDYEEARALYEASLALRRQLGDKPGITQCLSNLGNIARSQGDYAEARRLYEESLVIDRELGDRWSIARSLSNLGLMAYEQGDYPHAQELLEEVLTIGGDRVIVANALNILGELARVASDYLRAQQLYDASLALYRELGIKEGVAMLLHNLGMLALRRADYPAAGALFTESLTELQGIGDKLGIANSLTGCATLAAALDQHRRAARLFAAAATLREAIGTPVPASEQEEYDRTLATSRACLDPAVWTSAWAIGTSMPLDEVIGYALTPQRNLSDLNTT